MEKNPELERLAEDFYEYLEDPSLDGGYTPKRPYPNSPNIVSCNIAGYSIETNFTDRHQCKLEVTGALELEELISIPYKKESEEPDWKNFLEGIFILIRERT